MRIAAAANESSIRAFERKYQIHIEPEFRSYLLTVNGMLQSASNDCDSNLFAFWQTQRICTIGEECPELQTALEEREYFVFADYMIWSWAYAIDLRMDSPTIGKVILVVGRQHQIVASSFFEFLKLYLEDSRNIYAI